MNNPKKLFSIIIPIYKNEFNLPITIPYIVESIPTLFPEYNVELILVNDGSPDASWEIMQQYQKQYSDLIRIASFTKNFGQASAIYYGLSIAKGDVLGVISADLQDPFELFVEMLKKYEEGNSLVCAIRDERDEHGLGVLFSKLTHKLIRRFINPDYPIGGFDFYLMDSSVKENLLKTYEKNSQPQLLLLWQGVPTTFIKYERRKREVGKSGWTLSKKIKLFIDIFTTYSYLPLRVMSVTGCITAILAFLYSAYLFISALLLPRVVLGWTTLAVMIAFFSGLILLSLGVLGEYLWRIFDEVKQKPIYIVKEDENK